MLSEDRGNQKKIVKNMINNLTQQVELRNIRIENYKIQMNDFKKNKRGDAFFGENIQQPQINWQFEKCNGELQKMKMEKMQSKGCSINCK